MKKILSLLLILVLFSGMVFAFNPFAFKTPMQTFLDNFNSGKFNQSYYVKLSGIDVEHPYNQVGDKVTLKNGGELKLQSFGYDCWDEVGEYKVYLTYKNQEEDIDKFFNLQKNHTVYLEGNQWDGEKAITIELQYIYVPTSDSTECNQPYLSVIGCYTTSGVTASSWIANCNNSGISLSEESLSNWFLVKLINVKRAYLTAKVTEWN